MTMNRRNFLKTGLASAAVAGSGLPLARTTRAAPAANGAGSARNLIFLVSDGMSSGTLAIADQFIRWRDGRPSNWFALYEAGRVRRGLMETASNNSIVTDSAAASAAWGGGHRVNNGALNIGPDGTHHTPILVHAKQAGKATGLVTTATATHATPAGFTVNIPHRGDERAIARQYFEREVDVILGGGRPHFGGGLVAEFEAKGYGHARTTADLQRLVRTHTRLLGLFADGHVPYEIDRVNHEGLTSSVPSLKDMTVAALAALNRNTDGFLLQVEGARVDHAAHANDIAGLLFDQIAFDEAIGAAVTYANAVPDTLVIITTDHGNANPGLSSGDNGGQRHFSALSAFKGSHRAVLSRVNAGHSAEDIRERIREATGLGVSTGQADALRARLNNELQVPYTRMSSPDAVLGQIIANHTDIGWVGNAHTSDHVELCAFGPGSDQIRAFQKNTDLFTVMAKALDLRVEG